MQLRLLYFASLREAVGESAETLTPPPVVKTVGDLRNYLAGRGGQWQRIAAGGSVRCAVEQQMVGDDAPLRDSAEVAFFPPVTGG